MLLRKITPPKLLAAVRTEGRMGLLRAAALIEQEYSTVVCPEQVKSLPSPMQLFLSADAQTIQSQTLLPLGQWLDGRSWQLRIVTGWWL